MQAIKTVGLDIAKSVFQVHGIDVAGNVVVRRQLKRRYVLAFFEKLNPALNSEYWTHCLSVTLGNGLSISEADAKRRFSYIAVRLKRTLWGNRHQNQGKIEFIAFHHSDANNKHKRGGDKEVGGAFRHGRSASSHEHYHAFMHVGGGHGRSNEDIAAAIREIEKTRNRLPGDKEVHVDSDWWNGNAFHGYVTRQATREEMKARMRLSDGTWADFIEHKDKWFDLIKRGVAQVRTMKVVLNRKVRQFARSGRFGKRVGYRADEHRRFSDRDC